MMAIICILSVWITYFSIGMDSTMNNPLSPKLIFWFVLWTILITIIFTKWLSKFNKDQIIRSLRRAVHILLAIVIISMCIIGIVQNAPKNSKYCDEKTTLTSSKSSVFPIATDGGSGTAFAIDSNGSFITAYHVIDGQKNIRLNLSGGSVPLRLLRSAPNYDLALLKADTDLPNKSYLAMDYDYTVGDQVYAIGWPANTFTAGMASYSKGIISRVLTNDSLKLNQPDLQNELEIVQTDAAINPGNSGGPLLSECGVVGIVSAISDSNGLGDYGFVSEQGIGYAISSKTARDALGL